MRTAFIFLNLWALHCTVFSSPPSPISVTFSSVNLRNVLQWLPGNGTPGDTHFTVQYAIYGDSVEDSKGRRAHWRVVRRCTEIVWSWCDLSNETWDLEQGYYARVRAVSRRASSKWALTKRFDPKSDTSFGPPMVSVEFVDNSAIITLKGPMRHQPNNNTPVVSMAALYPQMMYNLSIRNTQRSQTSHFTEFSNTYKYRLMQYDTEYCFSAKTKFLSMPVHCQSSAWYCITTPPDPVIVQLQRVIVGIVASSVCICMLVVTGYLLYHYLSGKGQKSPYILNPPSFNQPLLTFPPEQPNLILITVIQPSDTGGRISDPTCPKHRRHIADPRPGYAAQRSEAHQEPEEHWDEVSIDYGFVGVDPRIDVRGKEEERERRCDGGRDGNFLKDEHQKCESTGIYGNKEWRVEDGHSTGVLQAKSYLSQRSTHTSSQTHMPLHTRTKMSTLIQANTCSQVNSVPLTQTQAPLLSFQGATRGEVDREEDREVPGLLINKTPHVSLFHFPLNLQTTKGGGMGEENGRKVRVSADGKMDGGVEEGSERERVALLSAYTSQNIKDMSTSHADRSDSLPDDYDVLSLVTADKTEKDDDEQEKEGTIIIDWDPNTGKLVLPEMVMKFTKDGGEEEEEEEVNAMRGELTLDNVYVRQGSEEEAEAQRELERGEERGWEKDDLLTKWDLVISMDQ